MDYAIRCQELTKSFGQHHVLRNITMEIPKGKITTILGFSGAGKSTLIKHFLGLLLPTSGKIEVFGEDLVELDSFSLRDIRKKFGMLFQYAALFDSMSAYSNVAFPLREFTKLNEEEIREKVLDLFNAVGLEQTDFDKLPAELSGGMRKRVGLARALALEPEIILYDEPTTGLDPVTTHMVNNLIKSTAEKYRERQLTSVIISHDIQATLRISDFVAFLERGRIVEYLPVEEFKKSDNPTIQNFLNLH